MYFTFTLIIMVYSQIGLPREHTSALCKVYSDNLPQITKASKNESLKINQLNEIDIAKQNDEEYTMKLNFVNKPGNSEDKKFTLTREQIQILIAGKYNFCLHYCS